MEDALKSEEAAHAATKRALDAEREEHGKTSEKLTSALAKLDRIGAVHSHPGRPVEGALNQAEQLKTAFSERDELAAILGCPSNMTVHRAKEVMAQLQAKSK